MTGQNKSSIAEKLVLGSIVRVKTTTANDVVEGKVFAFEVSSGALVIQQESRTTLHNIRVMTLDSIEEVECISPASSDSAQYDKPLPSLNAAMLKERENRALHFAKIKADKIGVDVSPEAQSIFNALSKTMDCEWEKDVIVVYGEVRISSPYTSDRCQGGDSTSLGRVQKVLEGELVRLKQNR